MSLTYAEIHRRLAAIASQSDAEIMQRFFKTGPGQYGEGDKFIGVKVPPTRKLAREFKETPLKEVSKLVKSKIHEERLLGLFIVVMQYEKAEKQKDEKTKLIIYRFYLKHKAHINNWDLIDLSAESVVGAYLKDKKDRKILFTLAKSKSLWDRRIAMISCFEFIRQKSFETPFQIADILLQDKEDLIHKAVGWMIREAGNRDLKAEEKFLKSRYKKMPRTMLRYAIEKFPEPKRQAYLRGKI